MGNISVSLPSDGTTADVNDYNTPITTIVNTINGNLDNSNIASGAAIDGTKIAAGSITNNNLSTIAGDVGGSWKTWTPTWSNLTVGNGVQSFKYTQIGKTILIKGYLTLGTTTSLGAGANVPSFSLPVNAADLGKGAASGTLSIGDTHYEDNGVGSNQGKLSLVSVSSALLTVFNTAGTYATINGVNSTTPFTWGTGDEIRITGSYESA